MAETVYALRHSPSFRSVTQRELHTILVAIILVLVGTVVLRGLFPGWGVEHVLGLTRTYIGPSTYFFSVVAGFLFYVVAALVVEHAGLGVPRQWSRISGGLHWAFEASPLVGLLATFVSFLAALLTYSSAGPGPETQQRFIEEFAIAFGSSITGGVMALVAFTLQKVLPGGAT